MLNERELKFVEPTETHPRSHHHLTVKHGSLGSQLGASQHSARCIRQQFAVDPSQHGTEDEVKHQRHHWRHQAHFHAEQPSPGHWHYHDHHQQPADDADDHAMNGRAAAW